MTQQAARPGSWVFSWARDWDEIFGERYLRNWLALFDSPQRPLASSPFFHPDVVRAWLESEGGATRYKPMFLSARFPGKAEVLLPMVQSVAGWKQAYVRRLRPAGERFFDYHDPVVAASDPSFRLDGEFWSLLRAEMISHAGSAYDDCEMPRVRSLCHDSAPGIWELSDKAPFVFLDKYPSFDAYFASRKKSVRGDVQRQLRRLGERGELDFRVLKLDDHESARRWLPRFQSLRSSRYPDSLLPPGYMLRLFEHASAADVLHCSFLLLNGEPISCHLGFYCSRTLFWYLPVYDGELAGLSPGKVHIFMAAKWLFENNGAAIDFMRGQDGYKNDWTDGEQFRMYRMSFDSASFQSVLRRRAAETLNQGGYVMARVRRSRQGQA